MDLIKIFILDYQKTHRIPFPATVNGKIDADLVGKRGIDDYKVVSPFEKFSFCDGNALSKYHRIIHIAVHDR